jgi:hypothetical protein
MEFSGFPSRGRHGGLSINIADVCAGRLEPLPCLTSRLGIRTKHVGGHPELAVLLPFEHNQIFAGPRSRAS